MLEEFEKTEWIDGDTNPVHIGPYEWEHPERFFQGDISAHWTGERWEVVWRNRFMSGRVYMSDCPSRWRGRVDPPVDVLLGL